MWGGNAPGAYDLISPLLLRLSEEEELILAPLFFQFIPFIHPIFHSAGSFPVSLLEILMERAPVTSMPYSGCWLRVN